MSRRREKAGDEIDPRTARLADFYLWGGSNFKPGNLYQAAIAAGYSRATARSNHSELRRNLRIVLPDALRALGLDEASQAAKLGKLREAKTVRWNAKKHRWDVFEDGDVQLRATQEINRILDVYPAPKETGDSRPVQIIFPGDFKNLTVKAGG